MLRGAFGAAVDLTVIENSRIGIIGTGEGTTGAFWDLLQGRWGGEQINEAEFMRETEATLKMGLRFHNWQGENEVWTAPIDGTPTMNRHWDWIMQEQLRTRGPRSWADITVCGTLARQNLSCYSRDLKHTYGYNAYHFDGHLVGQFFRRRLVKQGVKVVDTEVLGAELTEQGLVAALQCSDSLKISADYYIDCSGFGRVLHQSLKPGWVSYTDSLTCDQAIPFQIRRSPLAEELAPVTECRAHSAGWLWQIPTATRWGCGMVYDSRYMTADQAVAQAEQILKQPIEPIKQIRFQAGRLEQIFKANVAFLGLNSLFLEPLQATSIHATIHTMAYLCQSLLRPGQSLPTDRELAWANDQIGQVYDGFADLIQLHYRSGRSDTEFWREQQAMPPRAQVARLADTAGRRWPILADWHIAEGVAGYPVCQYPMMAYGQIGPEARRLTATQQRDYTRQLELCRQLSQDCLTHRAAIEAIHEGRIQELKPREFDLKPSNQPRLHPLLR